MMMVVVTAGMMTILVGHDWGLLMKPLVVLVTWESTKEKEYSITLYIV